MAGWSSRNNVFAAGRHARRAQMISYEVVLLLSSVCGDDGRLALAHQNRRAQNHYTWGFPTGTSSHPGAWRAFHVRHCGHGGDQPLAIRPARSESELVAAITLEYSGFKFALFFLGEYVACFPSQGGHHAVSGGCRRRFSLPDRVPS